MKNVILTALLLGGMLTACTNKQTTNENMEQELQLTQEWDKVFPLSEKVNHKKVTFKTQYGLTLTAGVSLAPKPMPTAVSSTTSTRSVQPFS